MTTLPSTPADRSNLVNLLPLVDDMSTTKKAMWHRALRGAGRDNGIIVVMPTSA